MAMISVNHLQRDFVQRHSRTWHRHPTVVHAVRDLSFQVQAGEIFGLLGQNGAGKTTTIKTLTTLLLPTGGQATVAGLDVARDYKAIRQQINFIFGGELGLYRRLSARDNLIYFGSLYKLPPTTLVQRADTLLARVGLSAEADHLVETFSKGMTQKLQIARGLINTPKVLFMDEPTIGLDAISVQNLHQIILQAKKSGTTIVLTTHYLPEAELLCDHLIVIDHGQEVASGTVADVIAQGQKIAPKAQIASLEEAYITLIERSAAHV